MTTLTTAPVAPLLDRLFKDAADNPPQTDPDLADIMQDHAALMASKTDYQALYARLKDFPLAVSRETGNLLYMLARGSNARTIIEFGTSFGLSTIFLASALRDNGGGRLITCEFEPSKLARARENLTAAGLVDLVEFREGDALETLRGDLPETIDLLLLDGAKSLYLDILKLVEPQLRTGAFILADNTDFCPDYMVHICSSEHGYVTTPMSDDVELSMRSR